MAKSWKFGVCFLSVFLVSADGTFATQKPCLRNLYGLIPFGSRGSPLELPPLRVIAKENDVSVIFYRGPKIEAFRDFGRPRLETDPALQEAGFFYNERTRVGAIASPHGAGHRELGNLLKQANREILGGIRVYTLGRATENSTVFNQFDGEKVARENFALYILPPEHPKRP